MNQHNGVFHIRTEVYMSVWLHKCDSLKKRGHHFTPHWVVQKEKKILMFLLTYFLAIFGVAIPDVCLALSLTHLIVRLYTFESLFIFSGLCLKVFTNF